MPPVNLRPAKFNENECDLRFLRQLYASTRLEEVQKTGWQQEQIDAFLLQQFEAQHAYYLEQFTATDFNIIQTEDGTPIGRLYVEERNDEFRIIDISLLPSHQSMGIGRRLIQSIINKATVVRKVVRIHVETNNPAMRLYQRFGFTILEEHGVYQLMEYSLEDSK